MGETRTPSPFLIGAAAASLGAGLVHAAAAGTHTGAATVVRLFAVTAVLQVGWALVAFLRSSPGVLRLGVAVNGVAAGAWLVSRTVGLPWPDDLRGTEEISTQDLMAGALGFLAVALTLIVIARPGLLAPRRGPASPFSMVAAGVVLAMAVPGMAATHTHAHGHADAGAEAAGHEAAGHTHGGATSVTSLDDPSVTPSQRAAAQDLIDATTAAMAAFPDVASVQAAGYVSIGDGGSGFEHFVDPSYLNDHIELDPTRLESVVFQVGADGSRTPVSAMYILTPGTTMADAPDVAGPLTTWHDHTNLCWEGLTVVGTLDASGSCRRGTYRPTPPMLHVWIVDNPCGPFAGLEGHGTGSC